MATAKKLPSGSWRCLVYSHTTPSGKRIYKSFTCQDPSPKGKRICEAMAAQWARDKKTHLRQRRMLFSDAVEQYLSMREAVCSPRTMDGYRQIYERYLLPLAKLDCYTITSRDIQSIINGIVRSLSEKTVRNIYGFTVSVLKEACPDTAIRCVLPKKRPVEKFVPTDEQVKRLMTAVTGTNMELPILLAAFGPMRRGEICALRTENINGSTVHVCENMVKKIVDGKNTWIVKTPKSAAGDRYITFPDFVAMKWAGKEGRITELNPDTITKKFPQILSACGLPRFRFHDLRHYSASIQHALGIPDAYIMERGGWGDDRTLKAVYRHSMSDKSEKMSRKTNAHFEAMQRKIQHKQ